MKKITIALLAIAMLFAFVSCEDDSTAAPKSVDVTDETSLKDALDSLETSGAKIINITKNIELTDDLAIAANGITLKASEGIGINAGENTITVTGNNACFEDIAITAGESVADSYSLVIVNGDNAVFDGVSVKSFNGRGIVVQGDNAKIEGSSLFDNCRLPFYFDENKT